MWWWLRPALGRLRARLTGSWFWAVSLAVAGAVPLLALGHLSAWICAPSAGVLIACGLAALLSRSARRVGDLLLVAALLVVLMLVFLDVGPPVSMVYAVLVLGGGGAMIRSVPLNP